MVDERDVKLKRRLVFAGITLGAMAAIALASVWGATSLASLLGTSGGVETTVFGPGQGANGVDLNKLTIAAAEDTSHNPSWVSGNLSYAADHAVGAYNIHRIKFEVRDPSSPSNPWTTVTDVTAPDFRILNANPLNTFNDTFSIPDIGSGYEYSFRVWDSGATTNPVIIMCGGLK